jgi:hypothetical protein
MSRLILLCALVTLGASSLLLSAPEAEAITGPSAPLQCFATKGCTETKESITITESCVSDDECDTLDTIPEEAFEEGQPGFSDGYTCALTRTTWTCDSDDGVELVVYESWSCEVTKATCF